MALILCETNIHLSLFTMFNTLRLRQNGHHFPDKIFRCIFVLRYVWISTKISLKFVPKGQITNSPALVQIMTWCWPCEKPLSEPMMVSLLMYICVIQPQWFKAIFEKKFVSCQMPICLLWNENVKSKLAFISYTSISAFSMIIFAFSMIIFAVLCFLPLR